MINIIHSTLPAKIDIWQRYTIEYVMRPCVFRDPGRAPLLWYQEVANYHHFGNYVPTDTMVTSIVSLYTTILLTVDLFGS